MDAPGPVACCDSLAMATADRIQCYLEQGYDVLAVLGGNEQSPGCAVHVVRAGSGRLADSSGIFMRALAAELARRGDGALLLANMERMGVDPGEIDGVFLSHFHGDHTRGLDRFLGRNPGVTVYMPASFPRQFQHSTADAGALVVAVSTATRLFERAYSTGPMGRATVEQALVLDTPKGLVIMTGCAHPGIVEFVRAAKRQRGKEVRLLVGGFHLLRQPETRIRATISDLNALGVARVAPSHCTGERAITLFREAWGKDFLGGGCGAVIELP